LAVVHIQSSSFSIHATRYRQKKNLFFISYFFPSIYLLFSSHRPTRNLSIRCRHTDKEDLFVLILDSRIFEQEARK